MTGRLRQGEAIMSWRPVSGEHPRRGGRARPSIAATPRSRQLSEQVPPRRLQELVALDDLVDRFHETDQIRPDGI
jgi:hypothetical protein